MPKYSQLIQGTAKAWGIPVRETNDLYTWVSINVPPEKRGNALAALLRRRYNPTIGAGRG